MTSYILGPKVELSKHLTIGRERDPSVSNEILRLF